MYRYFLSRIGYGLIAIIGVVIVVFVIIRLLGDPAALLLPDAPPEALERFRVEAGLDRPILEQLGSYIGGILQGDLGRSLRHEESAMGLVLERLPRTLQLAGVALLLSVIVAVPMGVVAAVNRGKIHDRVLTTIAVFGQSVPDFWLGLMLMLVFGVWFKVLPISGSGTPWHLILPAITLATFPIARTTRLVRSGLLEVLGQDYIRTARAKGLSENTVVYRHALRNTLIPVITVIGLELGSLLGGAVIVETVFAWPGLGRLLVQALNNRDFPLIQAGVLFLALTKVLVSLLVDFVYVFVDPRIRY